ncbi:EAL domain-containing protein [Mangrovibacillus sp. Mu-81]|uniref:EAL domain-containing protein n=1 Tax=Mangrovibacillus sp. Mu-81 TaxID=3121478 RepID=UPI002FE4E257
MKNFITIQKGEKIEKINKSNYYKQLFENFPDALFLLDEEGYFVDINPGLEILTGADRDQLLYSHFSSYIYHEDLPLVKGYFQGALMGEIQNREFRIVRMDGTIRYVSITMVAAKYETEVIGAYGTAKDITDNKELEQVVRRNNSKFESLLQHSVDVFALLDANGIITYESPSICNVLGYEVDEVIGTSCFDYMTEKDAEKAKRLLGELLQNPNGMVKEEFQMIARDGRIVHCEANVTNLLEDENVRGIVVNYRDISDRKKYEQDIMHRAFHDYLTGLPNRYKMENRLQEEIDHAGFLNEKLAVLFIDLDRFKIVNDSMGHHIGDLLLKQVALRLKEISSSENLLFRQSGDEFIMILPNANIHTTEEAAKAIQETLAAPFMINHYELYCSPSIGISLFPEDGKTVDELIKHADFAMYQAKKSVNKTFQFFSSSQLDEKVNPLKMEIELHKALDRRELVLYYQPKLSLKTGMILGFEALMRWDHKEWGMISPGTFIPIAEDSGLIIPIGEWALYEACRQNMEWHKQGMKTTVSVNLSPRQFSQTNLVKIVENVLINTGLPAKYLELEITESMTADLNRAIKTLQKLKMLGVKISIDDFGTGFSSLNYLKRFPVDTLKIDQSFVRELHNHPNDETIVKTIISMAHHLNLNVVAEGIETQEQLVFLQQHLCDEGQGFLFCRPLPPTELQGMMEEVQQIVKKSGISQELNERMWAEELVLEARRELHETIRLQEGLTLKYKKVGDRYVHTFCEGELLYRFGMIPDQVVGKDLFEILDEKEATRKHAHYAKAWEGEENVSYEGIINDVHYVAKLRAIKRGGIVEEVICSCIDMTEQKKVEEALRESEQKYKLIAENMSDLISVIDVEGNLLYASPSHESVLGYRASKMPEMLNVFHYLHPEDQPYVFENLTYILAHKKPIQVEFRYGHANGEWMLLETSVTPIMGADGEVDQIVAVGRDITEKKKAEKLLWDSEKLSVVGELAAGVAHEIRNPITSIRGFIQLFQQGLIKEDYFCVIFEEFERIEEIVAEFLSLAKPQPIHLKVTDPQTLIKEVITLLSSEANLMNVQIEVDVKEDVGHLNCDLNQIKQVLINLVKNSIEALPNGGLIKVLASRSAGNIVFRVIDNGIGICKDRIEKLGEPFYSNKEKGTGLGLMLCFRIIKQHKGSIEIESEENIGTSVKIVLPAL